MKLYLCQLCNAIVTFSENHSCFVYKKDDNVCPLPKLDDLDEIHEKRDEAKDNFYAISDDNSGILCPEVIGNENEVSEQMNSLLTEDSEELSFLPALNRKRKHSSRYDETSNNSQCGNLLAPLLLGSASNNRLNETQSKKNASALENFKLEYKYERGFRPDFDSVSGIAAIPCEQNIYEAGPSTSCHATSSEECEMSINDLKFSTRQEYLKYKNISETSKFLFRSTFPTENKEPNKIVIDASRNTSNENISPEATSWGAFLKKPLVSSNDTNAVAGPSRIYPESFITADKGKLACDLCHKTFVMKSELDRHYQSHMNANYVAGPSGIVRPSIKHTVKGRFACDLCPKNFKRKLHLDNHFRTHSFEKPFVCDICKKAFSLKSSLKNHYWTHKSEKPFMCNKCEKGFTHQAHIARHYRTHTGEKPFVCDKCGRKFSMKCNLKTHIQTHTKGEK